MRKPKTYSLQEVFNNTLLGFTFEFYCSKESSFIIEDFSKILGKFVVITNEEKINPTYTSAILLKEYDGKRPRYQFKVGHQKFNEVNTLVSTILFWINENASLDNNTLLKVNLDFDFKDLQTITSISNMDLGKLILKIDENYIYTRFPEMQNNPFALSIKKLIPYNMSSNASNVVNLKNEFKIPKSNYYGLDLSEHVTGDLKFNYIGGPSYSEKPNEIYQLLEYFVITTYQCLNDSEYTPSMVQELNKLTEEYRKFRKCYYDPKRFNEVYKDIKIFIDLQYDNQLMETQWFQIRDVIGKLILESDVKKCKFNWDTELGVYQIKNATINNSYINGFQIVSSEINGIIENCHLWQTTVSNSRIINSTLVVENKINSSYLNKVRADRSNKINESFIYNAGEIINCDVTDSIIKNAGIGNGAKLDENCLVINPKQTNIIPSKNGIESTEIRDYNWLKTLRRSDYKDTGYGNEYKEIE